MISISQRFTLVTKIMKIAWSLLAMYRLRGFYRILLSQILVQNQTNYMGNSRPNQHKKMSTLLDFNETWGTHTLP